MCYNDNIRKSKGRRGNDGADTARRLSDVYPDGNRVLERADSDYAHDDHDCLKGYGQAQRAAKQNQDTADQREDIFIFIGVFPLRDQNRREEHEGNNRYSLPHKVTP